MGKTQTGMEDMVQGVTSQILGI